MQRAAREAMGAGGGEVDYDQRVECRIVHRHGKPEIRLLGFVNSIIQRPQNQEDADAGETNRGSSL